MERDPNEPDDWCAYCGAPLPLDSFWGKRRFCCREHTIAHRVDRDKARRAENRKGRTCKTCGGPVPETRNARAIFCSKPCKWRDKELRKRAQR